MAIPFFENFKQVIQFLFFNYHNLFMWEKHQHNGIQSLPVSQKWSKGPRLMESAVANRHACFQIPFSDAYHSNVNVQAWPHWQTLAKMNLCHSGEVMVFAILP